MDWKKIFAACETIEELKKAFKKACMSCHPDKGGSAAEFKAMTAAHDKRAAELAESESRQEWQRNKKADGTYKTAAEILADATAVRFDGSDLMPGEVGAGSFWKEMTAWISGSEDLDTALKNIDASWPKN